MMQAFGLDMSAALLLDAVLFINNCKKEANDSQAPQIVADNDSEVIAEHVLSFKARMEMFRNNPNLKSEVKYQAIDATTELENLINLQFGYGAIEVNKQKVVSSEITIPLDALQKVGESALSQFYYNQLIEEIKNKMIGIAFDDKKLMYVDLKHLGTTENNEAIIGIHAVVGNAATINLQNTETGWWYGYLLGDCTGLYGGTLDAVEILRDELNKVLYVSPPPGWCWRYSNIVTSEEMIPAGTNDEFINSAGDIANNNYQDYLIFYANSANHANNQLTDDDHCISTNTERAIILKWHFTLKVMMLLAMIL